MGELTKRMRKGASGGRPGRDALKPQEQQALLTMRREAANAGATLATNGKGGLPPSLVLGVMRRDGYRCKRCGGASMITVHHKGGLENPSPRLRRLGKQNSPSNIVTVCAENPETGEKGCHDDIHDEDRAKGEK